MMIVVCPLDQKKEKGNWDLRNTEKEWFLVLFVIVVVAVQNVVAYDEDASQGPDSKSCQKPCFLLDHYYYYYCCYCYFGCYLVGKEQAQRLDDVDIEVDACVVVVLVMAVLAMVVLVLVFLDLLPSVSL